MLAAFFRELVEERALVLLMVRTEPGAVDERVRHHLFVVLPLLSARPKCSAWKAKNTSQGRRFDTGEDCA